MCSTYLINGKYCETGADLIEAVGEDKARFLNRLYDDEVDASKRGSGGLFILTAEDIARNCLCHVDQDRLASMFGCELIYDTEADAFVAGEPSEGH